MDGFLVLGQVDFGKLLLSLRQPAAVVPALAGVPLGFSLGMVVLGLVLTRMFALILLTRMLLLIGRMGRSTVIAILLSAVILLVPGVVEYLFDSGMKVLSFTDVLQMLYFFS